MAIVQEREINGVTVRFHDDYCKNTDEDGIQKILARIAARALVDLNAETKRTDSQTE